MKLTINLLVEWHAVGSDDTAHVERVLWAIPSAREIVVIDIFNRTALPQFRSEDDVEHALLAGTASILGTDPFAALLRPEDDIDAKHRIYRDSAWDLIAPLVTDDDTALQLFSSQRGPLISRRCDETGRSKRLAYKYLRQYWQAG